ncbi:MAG: NosD domain-containing protein [Thermoplasmatota archaeon]
MVSVLLILPGFPYGGSYTHESSAANVRSDFDLSFHNGLLIPFGETVVWRDSSVFVEDFVRIEGRLEIYNSTVKLDVNRSSVVNVVVNGTLIIGDGDRDSSTSDDASEILGSTQASNLLFGSHSSFGVFIQNSFIRRFDIYDVPVHINESRFRDCRILSPRTTSTIGNMHMETTSLGTAITLDRNYPWEIGSVNISGYNVGIRLKQGELRLYESHLFNSTTGIFVDEDASAVMTDCVFERSTGPIETYGTTTLIRTTVVDGRIRYHDSPGYIHDSKFINLTTLIGITDGLIRNSTFDRCRTGIEEPSNTLIVLNRIEKSIIGVSDPRGCTIYHNVFKGNTYHADGSINSIWHNETLLEGNFWSTYRGRDDGSGGRRANDGIGDTDIPFLGRDSYPLMMENYHIRPRIPGIAYTYNDGTADVLIRINGNQDSHFIIQRSTDREFLRDILSWSTAESDLWIRSNPNRTLYFRAGSFNDFGSRGWSVPIQVTVDDSPLPPADIIPHPSIEGNSINLSWSYRGEDIGEAILKIRNIGENSDLPWRTISYPRNWSLIEGLENGLTYEFHLIAVDPAGHHSDPSEKVTAVPMDLLPPPPPKNITATPLSNESISLEWAPTSIKDLEGFAIYRRDPGSDEFMEIARTGWNGYSYIDLELEDNTTYEYGIRSLDNDGPMSEMVGPISARTEHNNHIPEMIVTSVEIELIEDEGPGSLDLTGIFRDEDGDEITIRISETHLFDAEIRGDFLWVFPDPDQEGTGYVQLLVSDGEASVPFYIGVFVEARPDAPRDVKIINPINGSTQTPGQVHKLQGYAYDPDRGDYLTVSWSSDRDGILTPPVVIGSLNNLFTNHVLLSPGIHVIMLAVWDSTMGYSYDNTTVAVSLWGFSDPPWSIALDEDTGNLTPSGGILRIKITNTGPILLTFICNATIFPDSGSSQSLPLGKRILVLQPDTTGTILFNLEIPFTEGETVPIEFIVTAETFNGTFAGERTMNVGLNVKGERDDHGRQDIILVIFGIIILILIVMVAAFVFIQFRRRDELEDLEGIK